MSDTRMGISGRVAAIFQSSELTPLLALAGLLLGLFAVIITPKEEEPQIDVTFANVFIPFPGASVAEVESLVATPAEQVMSELAGVEHVYSMSRPGMAVLTVQFEVGVPRRDAIVDLYNQVFSNLDWLPANLGALQPLVRPMGIDDVPIVSVTLWPMDATASSYDLVKVAHTLEVELKRVPGTRDIYTLGKVDDVVLVRLDPARLNAYGINYPALQQSIRSANLAMPSANIVRDNQVIEVQPGGFFSSAEDISSLVVGVNAGNPVYLADVADIQRGADLPTQAARMGFGPAHALAGAPARSAVTLAIAKQPGENAVDIATRVQQRVSDLENTVIPANIKASITRDYGQTAAAKASKLIQKLMFATFAVIILVLVALGWREALIVGAAIIVTLALTLFASWAWGFTLNRVSLFALIFSIGILVDDAIVVVENIHRHRALGGGSLREIIPKAVDEVGGPTILATFTVIAALMPMAFVSGLMGPYMSPIPINASTGMLISLIIAFVVTPWLALHFLGKGNGADHGGHTEEGSDRLGSIMRRIMTPFLDSKAGKKKRTLLYLGVSALIVVALALPAFQLVILKMLPFDNKSEVQVLVDMPEGTPLEDTLVVLDALAVHLESVPEVLNYQSYAGTSAPINFNGLVRQYYLRSDPWQGDIQVNLTGAKQRDRESHPIARSLRQPLQEIGKRYGATVTIVEVPPGPPVMAPLVAEIYGADEASRLATLKRVRAAFESVADVVDVDDSRVSSAARWQLQVDRDRAARLGVDHSQVVQTLSALVSGDDVSYLHEAGAKYAIPIRLRLNEADRSDIDRLLAVRLTARSGESVALADVVSVLEGEIEQPRLHKDLLPMSMVTGDMAGSIDSPLYAMFAIRSELARQAEPIDQHYISQPWLTNKAAIKWDGEWQITYETFRDMGIAYAVGMLLIYLLVVAQFKSYITPLIIMAPIPLTVIGVMPGHALLNAQFTATSMIGMIALAGIIVRNSILLVDFINQKRDEGMAFADAVITSSAVRAQPILLTALAAMIGALFILDDPIFSGLAVALIFGILVSSVLTLVVIPLLYFTVTSWLEGQRG
ncbi:efflux RND transporter permease subunit [Alcanivorax sp. 1008]|uniref:efflux RND transporter permease subunit n=1 Tax=Alcanivorax sp. 1008 TaxID=2816853 RepID=UPI001D6CF46C|nr:efflux RND transporter permease subunit [Alcanivorax sp. 1008]MCC1495535.1 efflux RND transporter permease subunit [Alcanivorax sp. 1008]